MGKAHILRRDAFYCFMTRYEIVFGSNVYIPVNVVFTMVRSCPRENRKGFSCATLSCQLRSVTRPMNQLSW